MLQRFQENKLFSYLGLFTSFGTLLCCALPSTLVLLGLGASLAGFLAEFPALIWFSDNKLIVFGLSFMMLGISYSTTKLTETKVCPIDKKNDCEKTKRWSRGLLYATFFINFVGVLYAFVLPHLL